MNVARQRLLNILTGIAFALLGFLCYGAAGYLALVAPKPIGEPLPAKPNLTACKRTLSELNFQVTEIGPELRIQKAGLDNPDTLLKEASLAIGVCGLPMTRFCMGPGCKPPALPNGMYFVISSQPVSKPTPSK